MEKNLRWLPGFRDFRWLSLGAWLLVLLAISAGVWFGSGTSRPPASQPALAAANSPNTSVGTSSGATAQPSADTVVPTGPIVDRMMDRPAKFVGSRISIEGNVRSVPATRVFSIVEPGSRSPLLVIATQSPPPLQPDDEIQASGKIVKFDDTGSMQRQYGVDLTPERVGNWVGKPVLVAESVRLQHSTRAR